MPSELRTLSASFVVLGQAHVQKHEYETTGDFFYRAEEWWLQLAGKRERRLSLCRRMLWRCMHVGLVTQTRLDTEEIAELGNNLRSAELMYDALRSVL